MKRKMSWLVPAALLALPGAALAQEQDRVEEVQEELREDAQVLGREAQERNLEVSAQAGLLTYTGDAAAFTAPGVSFGVLAGIDVTPWLGGEASYQGAAYMTDNRLSPGNDDIGISENGAQLVAKVGPQLAGNIQPYALGGLNLSVLDVKDRETAFGAVEDAFLVKLPVGAGVDWQIPGGRDSLAQFSVGARATYNIMLDSGAFPLVDDAASANQLQTTIQLGAQF
jgi:hypothetical protein